MNTNFVNLGAFPTFGNGIQNEPKVDDLLVRKIISYIKDNKEVSLVCNEEAYEKSVKEAYGKLKAPSPTDILFLSAKNFDNKSLLKCLPKEITDYIFKLKYPYLMSYEDFKKVVDSKKEADNDIFLSTISF